MYRDFTVNHSSLSEPLTESLERVVVDPPDFSKPMCDLVYKSTFIKRQPSSTQTHLEPRRLLQLPDFAADVIAIIAVPVP